MPRIARKCAKWIEATREVHRLSRERLSSIEFFLVCLGETNRLYHVWYGVIIDYRVAAIRLWVIQSNMIVAHLMPIGLPASALRS